MESGAMTSDQGANLPAEDELRIRALVGRYYDSVNRGDIDSWAATWARNGRWITPRRELIGRDAIVEYFRLVIAPYGSNIAQLLGQGFVGTGPQGAHGYWTFLEFGRKEGEDRDHVEFGTHVDRYVQEDGRWVFGERRLTIPYRGWVAAGEFFGFPPFPDS